MKVVHSLLESNQKNMPLIQWSPIDMTQYTDNQQHMIALCTTLVILLHVYVILHLMPPVSATKLAKPLPIEVTLLPAPKKPADANTVKAKPIEKPKAKVTPPKPKSVQKPKPVTPVKPVVKPVMPDAIAPIVKSPVLPSFQTTNATNSSSNTSSSATSKTSPAPQTTQQTDATFRPYYSSNPKPKYPSIARSRHLEGKVLLKVKVSAEGQSVNVAIDKTSGYDMLDNAAIEAVQNWKFAPARQGDRPVACIVTIPITFKLQD
jgi:protein TonB